MKTYYWKGKPNFGDLLTPLLLKRFAKIPAEWSSPAESDIVVIGSVLEHIPQDYKGIVVGCGKLHEKTVINLPQAKILALRGPLTAKGLKGNFVLADAGLLADELVKLEDKEYELGIVPHWTDKTLELNPIFKKYNPKIIRVSDDPLKVISEIGKCRKIVSSSLHGIILADAFAIPRRVEIAPRMLSHPHQEGGLFKWLDYHASINEKLEVGVTRQIHPNKIADKQYELFDVFEEVKSLYEHK